MPHRYLCTLNTPYFAKPRLHFQAHRPWEQPEDAAERYRSVFSAGGAI